MKRIDKLTWAAAIAGTIAAIGGASSASAQSSDHLIDKLVDKGVLTLDEAKELRKETDKDFTHAYAAKSGMPEWVTALKIGGDFRGRYEGFWSENPNSIDQNRFRYRLRFGLTALMLENFEVGLRLGSGDIDNANGLVNGTDPISNNQTLQNNASKKGIFIDLAYGTWHALNSPRMSADLTIGKMMNPFVFSPMVFDYDYTPEGGAAQFAFRLNDDPSKAQALKANLGAFVLDENRTGADPYLLGAQLRWDGKFMPEGKNTGLSATAGIAFLSVQDAQALTAVPDINRGNAPAASAVKFNPIVVDGALTYTLDSFFLYNAPFPITLAGEYLNNPAVSQRNQAYSVGITFGKAGKPRAWQLSYTWRSLEANSWYEEFVDSDFGAFWPTATSGRYGAGTNVKGHIAQFQYSPASALTLSLTAFVTELIDKPAVPDQRTDTLRVQADAMWKF